MTDVTHYEANSATPANAADAATALQSRFNKRRLNPVEASAYLAEVHNVPVAVATLSKWRCVGGGPEFLKFGRYVMYPRDSLDEWVARKLSQPYRSTSQAGDEPD